MSLIKWSFLWSAALMYLCTVSYSWETRISMSELNERPNCSLFGGFVLKPCNTQLNITTTKTYSVCEIILNENCEEDISLLFVLNVSTSVPSICTNVCSSDTLCNATLQHLCQGSYNPATCAGGSVLCQERDGKYILHVQMIRINNCPECCRSSTPPPTSNLPSTTTTMKTSTRTPRTPSPSTTQEAINKMNKLTEQAKSLCNNCSQKVSEENAKGLILKNDKNASISIGCGKEGDMVVVQNPSKKLDWSVTVPEEAFNMACRKVNETPFVVILEFSAGLKNSKLDFKSVVYGISMGVNITNLSNTINMSYSNLEGIDSNWTCMSSDDGDNWTTSGCNTHIINDTMKCACTHLTFFAILMAPPKQVIPENDVVSLTYITSIGCGLSIFFLIVGLFIHFVMWRSKTKMGTTILMHLFAALILLNITFLSNQQIASLNENVSCILIAATMHFSMLATFTWFFIQALHFYLSLSPIKMTMRKYKLSVIGVGWGLPALLVILIAASGNYEQITSVKMCWLTNAYVHYTVNVGYYALIFIFTSIIFIVIVRYITHSRFSKHGIVKTSSKKTGAILGLFVLLGLTWGVAFFSYGDIAIPSYYIFTILNSFQGFFLFLYYYFFRNDDVDIDQSTVTSDPSLTRTNDTTSTTSTVEVREA